MPLVSRYWPAPHEESREPAGGGGSILRGEGELDGDDEEEGGTDGDDERAGARTAAGGVAPSPRPRPTANANTHTYAPRARTTAGGAGISATIKAGATVHVKNWGGGSALPVMNTTEQLNESVL